jgi:hypothetical protein
MAISEIWVPEAMVCLFLALPLLRPLVKSLWPLDGLVWLPLIALAITAGIFPAYGFRPECLPILLFAFFYNAANFSSIVSSIRSQPSDAFRDRNIAVTVLASILLGAAVYTMYAFSPRFDGYPKTETAPSKTLTTLSDSFGRNYCLQIYGSFKTGRPVIFLVPPEIGSSASVEFICTELENKGYTVVTYSRKDFDFMFIDENGKKHLSLPAKIPGYLYAFARGTRLASANDRGRAMEAARQADIEYLLPHIFTLAGETNQNELPPFLLVGYGAGGSALAYLNANGGFTSGGFASNKNVAGIVAVESRLWSSYQTESPAAPKDSSVRKLTYRILLDIVDRLTNLLPRTLKRKESLPSANLPVLYLVSGRALNYPLLDYGNRNNPYQAIFDTLRSASGPRAMAAIEGAGPLDYQDFPVTHPIYSFSLPGKKDAFTCISDTAAIISNFASLLFEQSVQAQAEQADIENDDFRQPATVIPPRSPISGSLYVESKGMPWLKL